MTHPTRTPDLLARLRSLSREEKLALFGRAVEETRSARAASTGAVPIDGSRVLRLRLPNGRALAYRLSADDLAL